VGVDRPTDTIDVAARRLAGSSRQEGAVDVTDIINDAIEVHGGRAPERGKCALSIYGGRAPEHATARGEVIGAYSDLKFVLERGNLRANNSTNRKNI
jgi:hypothetical protein